MKVSEIYEYLSTGIWKVRRKDLPHSKSIQIRLLRVLVLVIRSLAGGRWQLRASALTYYSLMSIIPALAFLFGIAQGFGLETPLERALRSRFVGQTEIVTKVVEFARTLLENVKGGVMAGIGLTILFWAIFKVLSQIENAFNDIWGIKKPRRPGRRVIDYLALMIIFPSLMLLSSTATVFITSEVHGIVEKFDLLGAVSPVLAFLLKLSPFAVIWLLFSYLYIFMPNTRISFKSGVLSGFIAGACYQLFQGIYINSQIGLARYNAIYGSFAALPLFIFWLHFSWLIVLLGAELSCALQNVDTYEFELDRRTASHSFKRLLSLRIAQMLVKYFASGDRNVTAVRISRELGTPPSLVNEILYELVDAGVASEIKMDDRDVAAYQPGRDPDGITVKWVIDALEENGSRDIPVDRTAELEALAESLEALGDLVEGSSANIRLKDI